MSNLKLFAIQNDQAVELHDEPVQLEKDLQACVERNMETLLGVRFLASEYVTSKNHSGRIDSLGLDENHFPVIVEYKRNKNHNVINQGLYYLDWLVDHQAEFQLLVADRIGEEAANNIDWSGVRLILIAEDFTKFDRHAVNQIDRTIDLVRYSYHRAVEQGGPFLLLDLISTQTGTVPKSDATAPRKETTTTVRDDTHQYRLSQASPELRALFDAVCEFAGSLGDVQMKELKHNVAFKNIKNFVSVLVYPTQDPMVRLYVKLNPKETELESGFTEDVTGKGHWGTGDIAVFIRTWSDFKNAKPLIERSYREN